MFGFHELLLYESTVLWVCLDGVGVQQFHKRSYNLLVDLIEFVRLVAVQIIDAWLDRCA